MHHQNFNQDRNIHALVTVKRSIKRALRQYFLQGWTRYHGHLINTSDRLAAFFPRPDIEFVKAQISAKRHWWFERDVHFHLRRQDGAVHLSAPTRPPAGTRPGQRPGMLPCLKLLSYNCQSLGRQSTRLQELDEDLHSKDIAIAALQGTRWPSADPRSEWTVKNHSGTPRFSCFSWGRPSTNRMLGALLLVSAQLLAHAFVHTRFDPPRGLQGRRGGIRLVSRKPGQEMDELFLCAYAPQETDDLSTRQTFSRPCLRSFIPCPSALAFGCLGTSTGTLVPNSGALQLATAQTRLPTTMGLHSYMRARLLGSSWPTPSSVAAQLAGRLMAQAAIASTTLLFHKIVFSIWK